jgi:hypothetical protein
MIRWIELGRLGRDRRSILALTDWQAIIQESGVPTGIGNLWLWRVRGPDLDRAGSAPSLPAAKRMAESCLPREMRPLDA